MSNFIDNVEITDEIGPHGLVIIKDKDGNILVRKHNMVVKSGKEIVFNKLLETTGFSPDREGSNWKLSKLYFGNNMNETTFDYDEINKIQNEANSAVYYSYDISNDMNTGSKNGHPYIEFNLAGILCDPAKASYLSCLSVVATPIITNSNNENKERLFSRIKFDPIPMVEGNELTLLYYIYF